MLTHFSGRYKTGGSKRVANEMSDARGDTQVPPTCPPTLGLYRVCFSAPRTHPFQSGAAMPAHSSTALSSVQTHLSVYPSPGMSGHWVQAYLAHQARTAFGVPPESGRVHIAQDFFRVDVPARPGPQPAAHAARPPPLQPRQLLRRSRAPAPVRA